MIRRGQIWTRRAGLEVVLFLAAAAASSSPAATAEASCAHAAAQPAHLSRPAADHALQCLINDARRAHGLRPVRAERHLASAAQGHASAMATQDFFAHDAPSGETMQNRVERAGYLRGARAWWLGEALAWGRGAMGSPVAILRGLLGSPPHRAILLDPRFRDVGIGVARGAPSGRGRGALTFTLDFGRRVRR